MNSNVFAGKRVLITGGLGFIGSNLAIRLAAEGARLTLLDSLIPEYGGKFFNINPIQQLVSSNISDVRDVHSIKFLIQGQDYLFNLAGQTSHLDSMNDPFTDLEINGKAQLSILEACRSYNPTIKVIFASTRQVYGKPQSLPVGEGHPVEPVDVNGINKLAGEYYHTLYNKVYGIRTAVLRLTNTFGPRMRVIDSRQTFLGIWIRRLLEGLPILVYGDGMQRRDFNFVDDVVEAILAITTDDESFRGIYNLGGNECLSLRDAAEQVCSLVDGGQFELVPFPADLKAIDIGDYCGDYSKINSVTGWRPKVSFKEGMKRTLNYYREHREHYWGSDKN